MANKMTPNEMLSTMDRMHKFLKAKEERGDTLNEREQRALYEFENPAPQDANLPLNFGPHISNLLNSFTSWTDNALGYARGTASDVLGTEPGLQDIAQGVSMYAPDAAPASAADIAAAQELQSVEKAHELQPALSTAVNIGAPALASLALGPSGIAKQMILGGAWGFQQGAGMEDEADASTIEGLKERAKSGLPTAGIGVAAPVGAHLLGKVGGKLLQGGGALRNLRAPIAQGKRMGRKALDEALGAAKKTGETFDDFTNRILAQISPGGALADLGGMRELIEFSVTTSQGAAKKARKWAADRNSGRLTRLQTKLSEVFGDEGLFPIELGGFIQHRSAEAKRLYDKAFTTGEGGRRGFLVDSFRKPIDKGNVSVSTLQSAGQASTAKGILHKMAPYMDQIQERARLIAGRNNIELPENIEFTPEGIFKLVAETPAAAAAGNVTRTRLARIDMEYVHYLRLAMDELAEDSANGVIRQLPDSFNVLRGELMDSLISQSPLYSAAANNYAGNGLVAAAMRRGSNIDQFADDFDVIARLSGAEKEAYRIGVVQNIIKRINNGDIPDNIDSYKEALRGTFITAKTGAKEFETFWKGLTDELQTARTNTVIEGTPAVITKTALKEARDQKGGPIERIWQTLTEMTPASGEAQKQAAADEIWRLLSMENPKKVEKILNKLGDNLSPEAVVNNFPWMRQFIERSSRTIPFSAAATQTQAQEGNLPNLNRRQFRQDLQSLVGR